VTVINNEFPFSTRGTQAEDKQFTFRVDPSYVSALTDMGVDIAGLANNHVLDYGADALNDTFDTLDGAGIDYMGAGADLSRASGLVTRQVGGQTIGFLAASRVIPVVSWDIKNASPGVFTTYDPALLLEAIEQAKTVCDYVVVLVHWGIERNEYPEDYQTTLAHQYIDAGADLIIGSHPHVLQGISYYKGKPIFYSLGNFIFNQSIPKTMAVSVTLSGTDDPQIKLIPAQAENARTASLTGDAAAAVYDYVESISEGITIDENGMLAPKE
jgi:poly-gamma-glutamate synthesis protein (capsule biosynthesis protein)